MAIGELPFVPDNANGERRAIRLAIVVSHPIQHFCPQYVSWAALPKVSLKVFFASDIGLSAYKDVNFSRSIKWEGIQLGFPHEFLPGYQGKVVTRNIDSIDLADRLSHFAPNALVVYGYAQRLQRHAIRWARSTNTPVMMISDSELRSPRGVPARLIKSLVLPRIFRNVDAFLTVGDANEAYYRKYGVSDDRLIRCPFPIDTRHFDLIWSRRDECRQRIRSQFSIPIHHKILLMVGKFVPWKRQADLIRLAHRVIGTRNDVTVLLAGTGPSESSIRALASRIGSGSVVFAGFVPPRTLAEHYCAADIYVHCAEREPHSLAISEAIYCGLPVVLSDRCGSYGPTDDVQPDRNGFVYRCADVQDMERRLLPLLNDDDLRSRMSQASRAIGRAHQELAHGEALTKALDFIESSRFASTSHDH